MIVTVGRFSWDFRCGFCRLGWQICALFSVRQVGHIVQSERSVLTLRIFCCGYFQLYCFILTSFQMKTGLCPFIKSSFNFSLKIKRTVFLGILENLKRGKGATKVDIKWKASVWGFVIFVFFPDQWYFLWAFLWWINDTRHEWI